MLFKHLGGPAKAITWPLLGFHRLLMVGSQTSLGGPAKAIAWPLLGFHRLLMVGSQTSLGGPAKAIAWPLLDLRQINKFQESLSRSYCSSDRLITIQINRMDVKKYYYYIICSLVSRIL